MEASLAATAAASTKEMKSMIAAPKKIGIEFPAVAAVWQESQLEQSQLVGRSELLNCWSSH